MTKTGGINSGYRAPNIDDMGTLGIVDFRYEIPTNDLKPEKSHSYEIGYKYYSKYGSLMVSAYYNNLKDLIARIRVPDQIIAGYPVYKKENIDKAFIRGLELESLVRINKRLNIRGQFAYAYGHNLTRDEPLRRIPPFHGRVSMEYKKNRFYLRPEYAFASKQTRLAQGDKDDNRIGQNGTAGWNVFNVYAGIRLKPLHLNLLLQNLGHADYRFHGSGVNGYGRSASLQLIWNL